MNYGTSILLMDPERVRPVFGGETDTRTRGGVFGAQGYGGGIFDGNTALSGFDGLGQTSESTAKSAQAEINQWLKAQGLCQIGVDGDIGPETCGAAEYYRDNSGYGGLTTFGGGMPPECEGIAGKFSPRDASQGCGPAGGGTAKPKPDTTTTTTPPPPRKGMSRASMFAIGGAVVLVAAAGAYLLAKGGKKRRRR